MTMQQVPMHLQPERVVTALAEAVMDLLLTPDGTVMIDYPSPALWRGMYLLAEASRWLGIPYPTDLPDWLTLLATPLAAWPLPLPPELRVNEALITTEGWPTPLAVRLAAQASGEARDNLVLWWVRSNGCLQ
jgi:hypothetical protein